MSRFICVASQCMLLSIRLLIPQALSTPLILPFSRIQLVKEYSQFFCHLSVKIFPSVLGNIKCPDYYE